MKPQIRVVKRYWRPDSGKDVHIPDRYWPDALSSYKFPMKTGDVMRIRLMDWQAYIRIVTAVRDYRMTYEPHAVIETHWDHRENIATITRKNSVFKRGELDSMFKRLDVREAIECRNDPYVSAALRRAAPLASARHNRLYVVHYLKDGVRIVRER